MPLDQFKTQVLLLHSEQSILDALSSGFNDRYTVHCATSGSEALTTLGETPINIIISAQNLPGMSGVEALSGESDRVYNDYDLNDNRFQLKFRKSIILDQLPEAAQIGGFVGHRVVALCLPDGFGEALHHAVLGLVRRAQGTGKPLVTVPDALRPIGTDLLDQGDMHAHVQEWIGLAQVWTEVPVQAVRVREQAVVLGVLLDHVGDRPLQCVKGPAVLLQPPGVAEHPAQLGAIIAEHHSALCL